MSSRPFLRPVEDSREVPQTEEPGQVGPHRYVLLSQAEPHAEWLGRTLWELGRVLSVPSDSPSTVLDAQITRHRPQALFLDFCAASPGLQMLPKALASQWPALPVIGLGRSSEPASMLAALRAGVHDFIDLDATPADAQTVLAGALARRPSHRAQTRGHTVALLGARSGLGVSTLAASMALVLQAAVKGARMPVAGADGTEAGDDEPHGVALLDLGLPARDSLMYLDSASEFSFVDGVRNLRRLDPTLVHSAFAHHASGLSLLPLPTTLAQMREISHADSVSLIQRLGDFFTHRVIDLGGFAPVDFVAQVARASDHVWVVCDQSLGGVVSTAALLRELDSRGLPPERLRLVVNQFDSHAGLAANDIAQRLGLALAHVVPARRAALQAAASRGEMLVASARNDAYSQAVQALARSLLSEGAPVAPGAARSAWQALRSRLAGRHSAPGSGV